MNHTIINSMIKEHVMKKKKRYITLEELIKTTVKNSPSPYYLHVYAQNAIYQKELIDFNADSSDEIKKYISTWKEKNEKVSKIGITINKTDKYPELIVCLEGYTGGSSDQKARPCETELRMARMSDTIQKYKKSIETQKTLMSKKDKEIAELKARIQDLKKQDPDFKSEDFESDPEIHNMNPKDTTTRSFVLLNPIKERLVKFENDHSRVKHKYTENKLLSDGLSKYGY